MLNHYRPNDYRAPRTLNEAFGPYATWARDKKPKHWLDWIVLAGMVWFGGMCCYVLYLSTHL